MMWSNLPGLRRALSKLSGLFVAATTITSLLETSWQSSCRRVEDIYTKYSNNLSVIQTTLPPLLWLPPVVSNGDVQFFFSTFFPDVFVSKSLQTWFQTITLCSFSFSLAIL